MKFSDLHLCVPLNNMEDTKRMIAKSSDLGFSQIGVPLPFSVKQEVVDELHLFAEEFDLDFVTRLDLAPKNPNDLLGCLRRFRRGFEVVSVVCGSKALARQAAKDRRVDLLSFPAFEPRKRFFNWAEAELARKSSAAFEIDITQVLSLEGYNRIQFLTCLRREVATAKSFGVPVVISSGATNSLLLRKPQDYSSLAFLFDTDASFTLEALSKTPASIVERNREKQSEGYLLPGVRIVKEKESS